MRHVRLIRGLINLAVFWYFAVNRNPYVQDKYERQLEDWFIQLTGENMGTGLASLSLALFGILVFYNGAIGIFRIITWNEIPAWAKGVSLRKQVIEAVHGILKGEDMRSSSNTVTNLNSKHSHFEKVKSYRNSKLGAMSQKEAAKEWAKTAGIDSFSDVGHIGKSRSYLNSKLGTMSQEEGYQYMKEIFGG